MLTITPDQQAAYERDATDRFAVKLQRELSADERVGAAARERPLIWYEWAVERALGYGIDIEIDVAEFAAQLMVHGDAVLDRDDLHAELRPKDKPGWLKVLQFARGQFILPREDR